MALDRRDRVRLLVVVSCVVLAVVFAFTGPPWVVGPLVIAAVIDVVSFVVTRDDD